MLEVVLKISSFVVQSRVVVKMIFGLVSSFKLPHNGLQLYAGRDFTTKLPTMN